MRFATVINCMDGRVQDPAARWVRQRFGVEWVDTITEAGADRLLAEGAEGELGGVWSRLQISLDRHLSAGVAVVGHADCAGNPVDAETHWEHVRAAVRRIRTRVGDGVPVHGLWVDADLQVHEVKMEGHPSC